MVKTVFISFIHGFKGDEETFFQFPEKLRNLVAESVPDLNVHTAVYPKYDTRGDLAVCVEDFKEWLQGQITDLETHAATPLAIQNPSVGVILVAHSVGGLVAADTLFSVLDNRPISTDPNTKLMFPLIHGLIAFDTPYNGLSRSMFAYGAFSQYQNLRSIWSIGTSVGALLAGSGTRTAAANQVTASQSPSWKRWYLLAARTGTYGAIIAGGLAAYVNRAEVAESLSKFNKESISSSWSKVNSENIREGLSRVPAYVSRDSIGEGFTWMASHLKFVGALMKPAQLKMRLERLGQLKGIGVANFYTSLGENGYWTGGYFFPKRTFCAIPREPPEEARIFREQPNVNASDEIAAHCSMFRPDKNPRYGEMAEKARDLVVEWLRNDPRAVVDEYKPSQSKRQRSMSEAQLWDDDGNVLGQEEETKSGDEDESQLQAILDAQGMPEPIDGGVADEELQRAVELPLPVEDVSEEDMKKLWNGDGGKDASKTWRSRLASSFTGISVPSMPAMPSMSSMPSIPSIPSMRVYGRNKEDSTGIATDDALKRKAREAFRNEEDKGEAIQRKAEEQKLDAAVPEKSIGKGDDVGKEMEKKSEKMDDVHQEPKKNEETKADQVLTGWAVPQGDEVRQVDEMTVEEPEVEELSRAGKVPVDIETPIQA